MRTARYKRKPAKRQHEIRSTARRRPSFHVVLGSARYRRYASTVLARCHALFLLARKEIKRARRLFRYD